MEGQHLMTQFLVKGVTVFGIRWNVNCIVFPLVIFAFSLHNGPIALHSAQAAARHYNTVCTPGRVQWGKNSGTPVLVLNEDSMLLAFDCFIFLCRCNMYSTMIMIFCGMLCMDLQYLTLTIDTANLQGHFTCVLISCAGQWTCVLTL